ncbi:hypothetical protein OAB09_03270 [Pelagibacteraceae bacterium]|jgi:hypothetical protein|nr:hypothetical protein [Pelagibacteraceae bacterium]MDC0365848.1 hypothetical protein [Pelagibacteraceae bacterium]|tara:strand:- start:9 stop:197 length:189 start_codon:yes stop_codon:yes gene_type:complete
MSSQMKFQNYNSPDENPNKGKVKLTDLLMRLEAEKKKERKSNIAFSVATISAVAALGVILSL